MQPFSLHVPHRVFGMATSGNCHKVKLACDILRIPYRWHETDIMKGESRTPEYLRMNPNGRVPVLEDDGEMIAHAEMSGGKAPFILPTR